MDSGGRRRICVAHRAEWLSSFRRPGDYRRQCLGGRGAHDDSASGTGKRVRCALDQPSQSDLFGWASPGGPGEPGGQQGHDRRRSGGIGIPLYPEFFCHGELCAHPAAAYRRFYRHYQGQLQPGTGWLRLPVPEGHFQMNYNDPIETASPVSWRHYLNIGLRFRWWLISAAVLFWAAALVASVMLPAKYKSETLVLVEPVNAHYGTPNLSADLQQRLQSLTEQTLSRPRLMQVVRDFQLFGYVSGQPVSDGVVKQMRNDISIELTKSTGGDISAFKITYSGASPEAAQKVIAALSSLFIRDGFDQQQRLTADTTSFLSSQLEEARQDMERQASLLQQFRSRHLNEQPEQRAINLQILTGLQDRLRSAIDSLHQAERQKLYFGSLIGWTGNSAEASG